MTSPDQPDDTAAGLNIEEEGHNGFPVVGIGASAGGIDAFQQLLGNLPADTGMAFVLVQHLDPHHQSRLSEVLSRFTAMPVLEADHNMALEPNHIYIIPPNANLAVSCGLLQVTPRGDSRHPHLPLDYLFRSLAQEQKGLAIGVVLSGTGSDGTQGLAEIKAVGGITFAQDEKSAAYTGMPVSAALSGSADFILPPDQIAKRLAEIGTHPYLVRDAVPAVEYSEPDIEDQYKKILQRVRAVTGVDYGLYRDTTIKRRILRRMALHTHQSMGEYAQRLDVDEPEVQALCQDMLINVTSFFRDADVFEALKQVVYPQLVKDKPPAAPIRVWVPGCSTGQEAYSIAISLVEFFDNRPIRPLLQIFATDLSDPAALERARAGLYPESIETEVSAERLRRFFVKEDHMYRVAKSLRDLCIFARQNIAADPPFSHVDLVSCRNLLIYLSPALQRRVLPSFHYALNTPGFLVLGSAESIGDHTDLFDLVDRPNKIYSKKPTASRPHIQFVADDFRRITLPGARRAGSITATPADFQREADRILLGRYSPAGVLVNENLDIIQFRGHTSTYLEPPQGEPTTNLLKMAREGLFLELRSACAEATRENRTVRRDQVRVRSLDGIHEVGLEVTPVHPPGVSGTCLLVLFIEGDQESATRGPAAGTDARADAASGGADNGVEAAYNQLAKELSATKEYMQTLIEQQDAANEELRSANEEILSSNEELQSTNEELGTAKEELQSTNEELSTVNEQLQFRNVELNALTNDLTNLLTSSGIPVVMVGPDLRVRRFTTAARRNMNLLASDIGRPIGDLKPPVDLPDLEALIGEVIDEVQVREREVRDRDGRWNLLRIHPYRTLDNKIDGAVILLLDIDEVKRVQEALAESEAQFRFALQAGSAGTLHRDLTTGRFIWDDLANTIFGLPANSERSYEKFIQLIHPDDRKTLEDAITRSIDKHERFTEEVRVLRPGGDTIWLLISGQGYYGPANQPLRLSSVCIDISVRKRLASDLDISVAQLKENDRRKDEFLAMLAHELRNPLAPITNAVGILRNQATTPAQAEWCRDVIDRQLKQMSRLLDDLLDVSRITRNKLHFKVEQVELRDIVDQAIEAARPLIDEKKQKLSVTLPKDPVWLNADPLRLTQVMANLLNNASKFTGSRGEIALAARFDGKSLTLSVKDSGSGIAPELLPRVFDIFVQGEGSGTSAQGGLGLGLTLAQHLVELHDGTLEGRSEGIGKGSEFVMRLPALPRRSQQRQSREERVQSPEGGKRVLVVEDREVQAQSLCLLLETMGHQARFAFDGPSAVKIAGEFNPEVALIDIGLPGMNGYELARRLREQPQFKDILLIAQTGWGRAEDQERAREAGFDHHMAKPLNTDTLLRIIGTNKN